MSIELKEINRENFIECVLLTTNKEAYDENGELTWQIEPLMFEETVDSNVFNIALSKVQDGWSTKAIYNNDIMIGFAMFGYNNDFKYYEIASIMIDARFQGKGYGTIALKKIVNDMKNIKDCEEVFLQVEQENQSAIKFYERFGFTNTGKLQTKNGETFDTLLNLRTS